jgi:hypothetical protein
VDSVSHGEYLARIASRSELTQAPAPAFAGDRGRESANGGRFSAVGILDLPCALAERKEVIQ